MAKTMNGSKHWTYWDAKELANQLMQGHQNTNPESPLGKVLHVLDQES